MGTTAAALADRIDALLPQTQCRRCGHAGCRPYAEAIAAGKVPINRCPPGGEATITALAALLDVAPLAADPAFGTHEPPAIACIDEAACIGCTLCIKACPVDAIVGAARLMHTVLAGHCTGCGLCLPPCPVDCIAMVPAGRAWTQADAQAARGRFDARNERLAQNPLVRGRDRRAGPAGKHFLQDPALALVEATPEERRRTVADALARARARRAAVRDRDA
ncbi:MAG: RnfABCDGE type electron transport complex subunit B [Casimicrobiaceae bacterium]